MEWLKHTKLILALVLVALAAIVFWQNQQPVVLQALWIARLETTLPIAMAGAFALGVLVGALAFSRWKSRQERARGG